MKRIRYISALLALIFALLVFGAALFEAAEYDHDCCGEGCGICAVLQICENMLKLGAAGGAALTAAVILTAAAAVPVDKRTQAGSRHTLISLRVRLDS